jgi:glycosyltransferase involved in cell wall biosynthesis
MNKVLVVGPNLKLYGGVAFLLKTMLSNNLFSHEDYFSYGNNGFLGNVYEILSFSIMLKKYTTVHLNPSFEYKSIFRDLMYAAIGVAREKHVIVSWMGWNEKVEKFFLKNKIAKAILLYILNRCDINVVSNELFKVKLEKLGYSGKIIVIFPPYDNELANVTFEDKKIDDKLKILFLARIENSKGIDKLLEIFDLLNKKHMNQYEFTIAGDGPELMRLKKLALDKKLPINFTGYVKGEQKIQLLNSHHIFLFPSQHPEGVPLILAEAMKAGLYLVVSDTGGIASVISNKNGIVLNRDDSADIFYKNIINIDEAEFMLKSQYNMQFSEKFFSPAVVAQQYQKLYGEVNAY